jgi:hypothetical protein
MPSTLERSRDFMTQAVARVRSGIGEYGRRLDQPGPEIEVEPFGASNVSTPAALIKLGTSIAAARRHRANYQQGLQDADLERQKTRAEIARLRSMGQYYDERPRTTGRPAATITDPRTGKETTLPQFNANLAAGRDERAAARHGQQMATAGKVGAAWHALERIDASAKTDVQRITEEEMRRLYGPRLARARSTDPNLRDPVLRDMGIDPAGYKSLAGYNPGQALKALEMGEANLRARVEARVRRNIERYYLPLRQRHESVIQQASLGAGAEEEEAATSEFVDEPGAGGEDDDFLDYTPQGELVPRR